ncbi:MAG: sugar O-acetyltransferase [Cellulomonadaceae bacterium]|jgi:maltose O-acetyltransferase|nr:sugar O-acetyltransferase [Cellulomonadaceae bacterium]
MPRELNDAEKQRLATLPIRDVVDAGEWFRYLQEPELQAIVRESAEKLRIINDTAAHDPALAAELLQAFAPGIHPSATVYFPVNSLEYPDRVTVGEGTFINGGLTVISGGRISIGAHCFIGPNCQLFTPNHHKSDKFLRREGWQYDSPISIGDDCWLGGSVIILPGVTIGDNVIIGAGSVVTKDVPSNCVIGGNPAHHIRSLDA